MRILSLLSSSTEIVCALGLREKLVGRSHECDYPAGILSLPACSEPKFSPDGKSYEIDQRIKAIVQEGLSVYRVHGELLRELRPDVILTQIQCEVCAVSEKDVLAALTDWSGPLAPKVVALNPHCLADLWSDIARVARGIGAETAGESLIRGLQNCLAATAAQARKSARWPRVACIEWIDPLMAAGNWVPELVELAHGQSLFGEAGKHSPWMSLAELGQKDPDLIVVMPCGFGIPRIREEMPVLSEKPEWRRLRAVREGQVYLVDGNQFFNRPGPRLVESLRILAEMMHPESFPPTFSGTGWVPG